MATLSAGRATAQTARPGATVRRARHARAAPRAAAFVETPSFDVAEWTSTEVEAIAAAGVEKPDSFVKDFSKPMSIPQEGIDAAVEVMRTGRIFRYSSTRYVVYCMWCTKKLLLAKPTPVRTPRGARAPCGAHTRAQSTCKGHTRAHTAPRAPKGRAGIARRKFVPGAPKGRFAARRRAMPRGAPRTIFIARESTQHALRTIPRGGRRPIAAGRPRAAAGAIPSRSAL